VSWTHCTQVEIADNLQCPTCGLTKDAWTLTVNATRTFVVSHKGRARRQKDAWLELELPGGAGVTCEVELPDGQVTKGVLDGAGVLRLEQLYPGECRARFPGRAIEPAAGAQDDDGWTPCDTGRRHPFRWRDGAVQLTWPARTHTQWVNLAPDAADGSRGNLLKVTASAPGKTAFARLDRGVRNSPRNDPLPGLVGGGDDALALRIDERGDAVVVVDVGLAGGDTFTLRVGSTAACADDFVEVTNWRRLSCQVTTRAGRELPDLSPMIEALRDVFIDFEVYRQLPITEGDPSLPPGSWMDASERSSVQRGQRLIAGNHNRPALQALYDQRHALTGVHLLVVDECFDAVDQERWNAPKVPIQVLLERELSAHEPQTLSAFEHRVEPPRRPGEKSLLIFNKKLLDGTPSLVSGTWESKAPPGHPDHGKAGTIGLDDIKKIRFNQVTLELVREELARSGGHPVLVRLRFEAVRDGNLGQAESFHMVVVQGSDDVDPRSWSSTVMHELGHVLHQAGTAAAPGLPERGHERVYLERGHVGHHCGFGLTDAEWGSLRYVGLRGTCLMFGEVTDPPNLQFCERCRPFILADACQTIASARGLPVTAP
jgi:hypothetical protein